ncbi:hypothetical protein [Paenibacillus mendelii]|uniref:DUF4190 domain-containing protein n=1 Tax=Paenibacillus mendelii TaxID=206163 RepID=A0ABV6JFU0_9BACL|nr:hypothetical protein [Paenibacillus mendelii]MCQ6557452.1 hypothetical protein [Paenibacillus mendelii]
MMAVISVLISFSSFFLFMYPIAGIVLAVFSGIIGHKSRFTEVERHMWVGGNPGRAGRDLAICSILFNLFMFYVLNEVNPLS